MNGIVRNTGGVFIIASLLGLFTLPAVALQAQECAASGGLALQVLGSGGPIADDARASSGYILWVDGRAQIVVDLGAGTLLRYAESGAQFRDVDAVLLSHLHADHSADLPAFLKSGYFAHRDRDLLIAGPDAGGNKRVHFPALDEYLRALFDVKGGAYGYLGGYLDGSDGLPKLQQRIIATQAEDSSAVKQSVLVGEGISISARRVGHGPVPAVAYRVAIGSKVVVFAGDQDGRGDALSEFANEADLLVLHMPIPQNAPSAAKALHAEPSRLGEQAASAGAGSVLLSHFMARSLRDLDGNVQALKREYDGEVLLAQDLLCVPL